MVRFEGIYCALWTPTNQTGEILWSSLETHLAWVLNSGIRGIMALGSTGEFAHLTLAQRKEVLERVTRTAKELGRQVIANVSDVQIRNAVALASHAKSIGADCVSVLPPWFFPAEQRDLAEFFIEIGRQSGAPLALYNFPEVTGKRIALETIEQVARKTEVVAVKQSGAEFDYHHELLRLGKDLGFCVLTGSDTRLQECLDLGCTGTVSGLANTVPEALNTIFQNNKSGLRSPKESGLVSEVAKRMAPLVFPLNVKATIAARGFDTGEPKMPVSSETLAVYQRVVDDIATLFGNSSIGRE